MDLEVAKDDGRSVCEIMRMCDSYSRLPTLIELWQLAAIEWNEWLMLLGQEWSMCDNISMFAEELLTDSPLLEAIADPTARALLMNAAERLALENLPEEVVVWRGCYSANKWGLSWSLDRDVAAGFPKLRRYRQEGQPLLVKALVLKRDILALKLERNEAEVIAWRGNDSSLKHISTTHIDVDDVQ